MPFRSILAAAVLAAASLLAHATPQLYDATDLWFDGSESGWGLNVIHQGDTLFATLFVYGPDRQPTWYVASELVGGNDGPQHDQGFRFTGPLYTSSGTWFGAQTFDPASSTRRQVGTMTLDLTSQPGKLDYTVDGVHVSKEVTRFSFRPIDLSGLHRARLYQPASGNLPQIDHQLEHFGITDNGSTLSIYSVDDSEPDCDWVGTRGQDGQYETGSGTYSCGLNGSSAQGTWSMRVDPTPQGFTGFFTGYGITSPLGRIAGALAAAPRMEGTGLRNGMWFVPSEAGWGVNIIEQGDAIFATLFVYDAQGKPHWYVASDLAQSGSTSDGSAVNSGPLYEATGPYFGAGTFDPGAVNRRPVGTMSFQVKSPGDAVLSYAVDGVAVTKDVTSFTFARNDASGTYRGQITDANGNHDPAIIAIADSGSTIALRIQGMYGGTCDYSGPSRQVGQAVYASGSVQCGGTSGASFVLKDLLVSFSGVTGRVELGNVTGFVQDGLAAFNLAGARADAN